MDAELFDGVFSEVAIHTPIDSLFAEYRKSKAAIERIAGYVAGEDAVMRYFFEGMQASQTAARTGAGNLFDIEPAVRALDADYWQRAMMLTDVLEYMPAKKRNEWGIQIQEHKTPAFDPDSVRETLQNLLLMRSQFLAERVDGLFRALSGEHVTNAPQAFGKRMIVAYVVTSYGTIEHSRANYIHDLRCVIAKFMGRDDPNSHNTYADLRMMLRDEGYGQWYSFDGNAFRMRIYKKGTAHLEIHPDMAWRLNSILASLYPMAIPEEFRRKPKKSPKPQKEFEMRQDLICFATLSRLESGRISQNGQSITFHAPVGADVKEVLACIGGAPDGLFGWSFDYDAHKALEEIQRTGSVPEQKTHQFYPTPESVAGVAIEMAQIQASHRVLEPSAGQGGLARFLSRDQVTCVELSSLNCKVLEGHGFYPVNTDFLQWDTAVKFDRVVMNPPFSEGRAQAHVLHALTMLNEDGRLVAVLPASFRGKEIAPGFTHEWSNVMDGEFKGTSVSVVAVALSKSPR